MIQPIARSRPIVLIALLPLLLVAAGMGSATTDPEASSAASVWLALIDAGEYQESWNEAALVFQQAVTGDQWVQQGAAVKQQVGDLVSREEAGMETATDPPGAPPGEYITITYSSEFTQAGAANEVVILTKEEERGWRVIGYFVQPPTD